jgi:hypothetical protein
MIGFGYAYGAVAILMIVLSIAWFYAGHMLAFFTLGKIIGSGDLRAAAKASLLVFGGYAVMAAATIAFGRAASPLVSGQYGFVVFILAYAVGAFVYLALVLWAAQRFYALPIGHAVLAALGIGFAYLIVTTILGFIAQLIALSVFMIVAASLT